MCALILLMLATALMLRAGFGLFALFFNLLLGLIGLFFGALVAISTIGLLVFTGIVLAVVILMTITVALAPLWLPLVLAVWLLVRPVNREVSML